MSFIAIAFGLAQVQSPTILHSRIVSAAVFKPGIAMLVREVDVPAGSGFYALDELPNPLEGSFWYSSPDLADISEVDTAIRVSEESKTYDAKTVPEMLIANVGRHIAIKVAKDRDTESVTGTLLDLQENSGSLTLKLDSGAMRTLNVTQVMELDPTGLATTYVRRGKVPTLRIQFKVSAAKASHVLFTTMEPGATWNASYVVDLGKENFCRVEGKAQLGLGGLRFEKTETKLMAGFPNLSGGTGYDLAAGFGSIESYIAGNTNGNFTAVRPGAKDPYDLYPSWVQQMQQTLARYLGSINGYGYGYGGFGGGGMGGGGYSDGYNKSGQLLPNDTSVVRMESLYAYPIGETTLEPGDRMTKLLFEQPSPYHTVFRWDANKNKEPVEQMLRVHNAAKTPWTGGVVTIAKDGVPLATTHMPFTAAGHDADLSLGSAPDILIENEVQQIKNEPVPNPKRPNFYERYRVTDQATISVENTKDEAISLEVVYEVQGEVKTDAAKIEKLPRRFGDLNPKVRVTWALTLAAGEQKRLVLTNTYLR